MLKTLSLVGGLLVDHVNIQIAFLFHPQIANFAISPILKLFNSYSRFQRLRVYFERRNITILDLYKAKAKNNVVRNTSALMYYF
jgi:hypothetical protein